VRRRRGGLDGACRDRSADRDDRDGQAAVAGRDGHNRDEPGETAQADGGGAAAPDEQSPEEQPGGAGDEVPASSQALITGRGGRLHPTVVRVPPFIAIRVELSSTDGVEYELAGGGRDVKAGGEIRSASTTYEGLRPGKRLVLSGPQGKVTIEATAEPGP
jgi:hypothetical protein